MSELVIAHSKEYDWRRRLAKACLRNRWHGRFRANGPTVWRNLCLTRPHLSDAAEEQWDNLAYRTLLSCSLDNKVPPRWTIERAADILRPWWYHSALGLRNFYEGAAASALSGNGSSCLSWIVGATRAGHHRAVYQALRGGVIDQFICMHRRPSASWLTSSLVAALMRHASLVRRFLRRFCLCGISAAHTLHLLSIAVGAGAAHSARLFLSAAMDKAFAGWFSVLFRPHRADINASPPVRQILSARLARVDSLDQYGVFENGIAGLALVGYAALPRSMLLAAMDEIKWLASLRANAVNNSPSTHNG